MKEGGGNNQMQDTGSGGVIYKLKIYTVYKKSEWVEISLDEIKFFVKITFI